MDGILPYQRPQAIVLPQGRPNPWASLAPTLLSALVTGYVNKKLQQNMAESLMDKENEAKLIMAGYAPTTGPRGGVAATPASRVASTASTPATTPDPAPSQDTSWASPSASGTPSGMGAEASGATFAPSPVQQLLVDKGLAPEHPQGQAEQPPARPFPTRFQQKLVDMGIMIPPDQLKPAPTATPTAPTSVVSPSGADTGLIQYGGKWWAAPKPGVQMVEFDGKRVGILKFPGMAPTVLDPNKHTITLDEGLNKLAQDLIKSGVDPEVAYKRVESIKQKPREETPEQAAVMSEVGNIMSDPTNKLTFGQAYSVASQNIKNKETGIMNDNRYLDIQTRANRGETIPPDDAAFAKSYEGMKKLGPAAYGESRGEILQHPVLDSKNNNALIYLSANEINKANKEEPFRYVPAGEGVKALNKTALLEDIFGAISNTRGSLGKLQGDFTPAQVAQLALVTKSTNPASAWQNFFRSEVASTLSQDQIDYLTDIAQLHENAMAMRSVLGAGQGSDELRQAIRDTIPLVTTPRQLAGAQLDKFEQQLQRLGRGIPSVKLNPLSTSGSSATEGNTATKTPAENSTPLAGSSTTTLTPAQTKAKAQEEIKRRKELGQW